jgi:hypothetical protein
MMRVAMIITIHDIGNLRAAIAFAETCLRRLELSEAEWKRRKIGRSEYAELREVADK